MKKAFLMLDCIGAFTMDGWMEVLLRKWLLDFIYKTLNCYYSLVTVCIFVHVPLHILLSLPINPENFALGLNFERAN